MATVEGLFVPGWAAPPAVYAPALPERWAALKLPRFAAAGGSLDHYRRWLAAELRRLDEPVVLAGHSMGAALAVAAAVTTPERIARLVLVAPAGLPLAKPLTASLRDFARQLARRQYPLAVARRGAADVLRAPGSALRVAQAVRALDLTSDLERVRALGVETVVVGCSTDTLVTLDDCRLIARSLGVRCRELDLPGGHMWMLGEPDLLRAELVRGSRAVA